MAQGFPEGLEQVRAHFVASHGDEGMKYMWRQATGTMKQSDPPDERALRTKEPILFRF